MADGARVHVVGSLNADRVLRVAALPRPGQTIAAASGGTAAGGKGGNQAVAAARAGARVRMAGAVGDDADGAMLLAALATAGVDSRDVARLPQPTGVAVVLVDDAGENAIVLDPGANGALGAEDADRLLGDAAPGDTVLLQGEIPVAASQAVADAARARGVRVLWNAAPAPDSPAAVLRGADVVIANEGELAALAALLGVSGDAIEGVALDLGAVVVVTLGADGVAVRSGDATLRLPSPRVDAVDTTAAGDAFTGVLAALLTAGAALRPALERAAAAGALTATRPGAAASIPGRAELDAFLAAR